MVIGHVCPQRLEVRISAAERLQPQGCEDSFFSAFWAQRPHFCSAFGPVLRLRLRDSRPQSYNSIFPFSPWVAAVAGLVQGPPERQRARSARRQTSAVKMARDILSVLTFKAESSASGEYMCLKHGPCISLVEDSQRGTQIFQKPSIQECSLLNR